MPDKSCTEIYKLCHTSINHRVLALPCYLSIHENPHNGHKGIRRLKQAYSKFNPLNPIYFIGVIEFLF